MKAFTRSIRLLPDSFSVTGWQSSLPFSSPS